jgi:glycosyltransferase involved in cell wall biosynthesis
MHLWSYSGVIAAPLLQSVWRLPYLFHVIMLNHYWPGRVDRLLFRWLLRRAGRVASLTPKGAEAIQEVHGVNAEAISPPVDMAIFRPRGPKDHRQPKVLFTGDLGDPRKGGALLLRAWDEIHRRCPEAVLVLAGPFGLSGWHPEHAGVYTLTQMKHIRSESARAAIEIRGPGSLEDLPRWYAEASVTVLPSVEEAFGMVITESLASGTPVVASSEGGPGEIIQNSEIGATVPIREYTDLLSTRCAHELADAVLYAIELSRKPGTADRCREWAEQWSLDRIGMRVEAILKDLASLNGKHLNMMGKAGM